MKNKIIRMEIELNNICQLKCPLCARQTIYSKNDFAIKKEIDYDELITYLETFPNIKHITLAGESSEPTYYSRLFDLIKYIHSRNIYIELYTNGEAQSINYYKVLGLLFKNTKSNIYLTIAGSTQKIHSKYRVGSSLKKLLNTAKRLNIICPNNLVMTWIIFKYNEKDFLKNKNFLKNFQTEIFYTLPFAERYKLKEQIDSGICLPDDKNIKYLQIDRKNFYKENDICKAIKYNFIYLDADLNNWPCSIAKHNNYTFDKLHNGLLPECFECSKNNFKILNDANIFTLAESEDEESDLRIKNDINKTIINY